MFRDEPAPISIPARWLGPVAIPRPASAPAFAWGRLAGGLSMPAFFVLLGAAILGATPAAYPSPLLFAMADPAAASAIDPATLAAIAAIITGTLHGLAEVIRAIKGKPEPPKS